MKKHLITLLILGVIIINSIQLLLDDKIIYQYLRTTIYVFCALLFLLTIRVSRKIIYGIFIPVFLLCLNLVLVLFVFFNSNDLLNFDPFLNAFMVLTLIWIGSRLPREINLRRIIVYYIFFSLIVSSVYLSKTGFTISSYYGVVYNKNQLGVNLGVAFLLSISIVNFRKLGNFFWLALTLLIFLAITVFRTRTILISVVIIGLIMIFNSLKKYKYLYTLIIFFIGFLLFKDLVIESFTLNFDSDDVNTLSSGRIDLLVFGTSSIKENIFLGKLLQPLKLDLEIHNFIVNTAFYYGIIGSFGLFFFYFWIFFKSFNLSKFQKVQRFNSRYLILLLYFVSLSEYTYPFGPVSSVFLPYLLYGYDLATLSLNEIYDSKA